MKPIALSLALLLCGCQHIPTVGIVGTNIVVTVPLRQVLKARRAARVAPAEPSTVATVIVTTTNVWTPIGSFTSMWTQPGVFHTHEVQQGRIVTNTTVIVQHDGQRHEFSVATNLGPFIGERRVPQTPQQVQGNALVPLQPPMPPSALFNPPITIFTGATNYLVPTNRAGHTLSQILRAQGMGFPPLPPVPPSKPKAPLSVRTDRGSNWVNVYVYRGTNGIRPVPPGVPSKSPKVVVPPGPHWYSTVLYPPDPPFGASVQANCENIPKGFMEIQTSMDLKNWSTVYSEQWTEPTGILGYGQAPDAWFNFVRLKVTPP